MYPNHNRYRFFIVGKNRRINIQMQTVFWPNESGTNYVFMMWYVSLFRTVQNVVRKFRQWNGILRFAKRNVKIYFSVHKIWVILQNGVVQWGARHMEFLCMRNRSYRSVVFLRLQPLYLHSILLVQNVVTSSENKEKSLVYEVPPRVPQY